MQTNEEKDFLKVHYVQGTGPLNFSVLHSRIKAVLLQLYIACVWNVAVITPTQIGKF